MDKHKYLVQTKACYTILSGENTRHGHRTAPIKEKQRKVTSFMFYWNL